MVPLRCARNRNLIVLIGLLGVGLWSSPAAVEADMMHGDDPLLALVPHAQATHMAVASGAWSNQATWDRGVPGPGAKVVIPGELTVTYDLNAPKVSLFWIRVDGALRFANNSFLKVDTLVVDPMGTIQIGTEENPASGVKILFADNGPIDFMWDPRRFSRGLISQGTVTMHGIPVLPYTFLTSMPNAGATQLSLEQPVDWRVGGEIVLAATSRGPKEVEIFRITGVSADRKTLTLDHPVQYPRVLPKDENGVTIPDLELPVGYLTRSIVLESERKDIPGQRGHFMSMHSPHVDIRYVQFEGLGRTVANQQITDLKPIFAIKTNKLEVHKAAVTPEQHTNPRGRYALHIHKAGPDKKQPPAVLYGNAVVGFPKVGINNHDSYVTAERNVVTGRPNDPAVGSALFTEVGSEIGSYRGNLCLGVNGVGSPQGSKISELGNSGHAAWLQGGGVLLEGNIGGNTRDAAFIFITEPVFEPGSMMPMEFPASNLEDPAWAGGRESVRVGAVPLRFVGNTAFCAGVGLEIWYHLFDSHDRLLIKSSARNSLVDRFLAWNVGNGFFMEYVAHVEVSNSRLIGNHWNPQGAGLKGPDGYLNIRFDQVDLEGFEIGVAVTGDVRPGYLTFKGGRWNNVMNFRSFKETINYRRVVTIDLNGMTLGNLPPSALKGRSQIDYQLISGLSPSEQLVVDHPAKIEEQLRRISKVLTAGDLIRILGHPNFPDGAQLFFQEQHPDYILKGNIPGLADGATRMGQAFAQHRWAFGECVAPSDLLRDNRFRTNGWLGSPVPLPEIRITPVVHSPELLGFALNTRVSWPPEKGLILTGGIASLMNPAADLHPGWNWLEAPADEGAFLQTSNSERSRRPAFDLIPRGMQRHVLVYGGIPDLPPNRPPVLNSIGNKTVAEGSTLAFNVSATDPDEDSLTFSATALPAGASFNPTTRTFSWIPGPAQAGSYTVTFTVQDSGGLADSERVAINVSGPPAPAPTANQAPKVNAGADRVITGRTVSLRGRVTDDGLPKPPGRVTVSWRKVSGPGTGTFSNSRSARTGVTFSKAGIYLLQLRASDGQRSTTDTVKVTVP